MFIIIINYNKVTITTNHNDLYFLKYVDVHINVSHLNFFQSFFARFCTAVHPCACNEQCTHTVMCPLNNTEVFHSSFLFFVGKSTISFRCLKIAMRQQCVWLHFFFKSSTLRCLDKQKYICYLNGKRCRMGKWDLCWAHASKNTFVSPLPPLCGVK